MEDEDGNFFGFNYNATVKEQYGLGKSIIGSINYMYDNIIESYVEDIVRVPLYELLIHYDVSGSFLLF